MAFCSKCGAEQTDPDAAFCSKCGSKLAGDAATNAGQPRAVPTPIEPRIRTSLPDFVKKALHPNEQVLAAFQASLFDDKHSGNIRHDKFALTTERVIYYHTGLIHKGMGQMPYKAITGVHYNKGLIHGKVVLHGANVGLELRGIGNADAEFAEKIIAGFISGRPFVRAV